MKCNNCKHQLYKNRGAMAAIIQRMNIKDIKWLKDWINFLLRLDKDFKTDQPNTREE